MQHSLAYGFCLAPVVLEYVENGLDIFIFILQSAQLSHAALGEHGLLVEYAQHHIVVVGVGI